MSDNEQWATVDLMGHAQTAGRITMESGLLRVDVPEGETYRTNYYGLAAIYHMEIVSEQIARAYAKTYRDVVAYDTPIVTRDQHQAAVAKLERDAGRLREQVRELERRLTSVNALPAPAQPGENLRMFDREDWNVNHEEDDEDEEE